MKQTEGAIGFLISAYRGILKHARFAALAGALTVAGAFSGAVQALDVTPSANVEKQTIDDEVRYRITSDLSNVDVLNVSGGESFYSGKDAEVNIGTLNVTGDGTDFETRSVATFGTINVSGKNSEVSFDDYGFTVTGNVNVKGGADINFYQQGTIRGALNIESVNTSTANGGDLTVEGAVSLTGANASFNVGEVYLDYDDYDGKLHASTGGKATLNGGINVGTGRVIVENGGVLNLSGKKAVAKFEEGSTLVTVSGKFYEAEENGKYVLKPITESLEWGKEEYKKRVGANGVVSVTNGAGIEADYRVLLNDDHSALNQNVASGSINVDGTSYISLLNMDKVTLDAAKGIRTLLGLADGAKLKVELDQSGDATVDQLAQTIKETSNAGLANNTTDHSLLPTLNADTSSSDLATQLTKAGVSATEEVKLAEVKLTSGDTLKTGNMALSIAAADGGALVTDKDGNIGSLELSDKSTLSVTGTGAVKDLTAAGTVTGGGTVTAESVTLSGDTSLLGGTTLSAKNTDLAGKTLFMDPAWREGSVVLTTGVGSGTDKDTLNGKLIAGQNSAFYIGDTENGSDEFKTEAAALSETGVTALGFIDKAITIKSGSGITVDGSLTSASSASGTADTVTVAENSKLTISKNALSSGAAVTFENDGIVNNKGTIEITDADVSDGASLEVFASTNGTVTDNTDSLGGAYTMLSGAFTLTPNDDGSLTAHFNGIQDENVDDGILNPVNAWIKAGNTLKNGSFLQQAVKASDCATVMNSAARFLVLSGAVQNAQTAQRASYDTVEERLGFGTASLTRQGQIDGTSAGIWVQPVYMHHDSDGFDAGKSGGLGVSSNLRGIVLGSDVKFAEHFVAGAALSAGSGDSHSEGHYAYTKNDYDFFGASVYGSLNYDAFTLMADAGFTAVNGDADQYTSIGKLSGDADTDAWTLGVQAKYAFALGDAIVAPHAGVRYSRYEVDSSNVKFNDERLKAHSFDVNQVTFPVGVAVSAEVKAGDWTVSPAGDVRVIFAAGDKDVSSSFDFGGGAVGSADSDVTDTVSFGARVGLDAQYGQSFGFGLACEYLGSSNSNNSRVTLNARYEF